MEYFGTKEAAEKWSLSKRRVIALLQEKRIPEAVKVGNKWLIPVNASKPKTFTKGKVEIEQPFRFPLFFQYITKETEDLLSSDEKKLYNAQILFTKGEIIQSDERLKEIIDCTKNIYVKIGALFFRFFTTLLLHKPNEGQIVFHELEDILIPF